MTPTPEQIAEATLQGTFPAMVLSLLWTAAWWRLSQAGWVRHWALRLPLVIVWVFLGALARASQVPLGIPDLAGLVLFPLLPFTESFRYSLLAMQAGMDPLEAGPWGRSQGMLYGATLALHCIALHWFIWRRSPQARFATERERVEDSQRREIQEIARRLAAVDSGTTRAPVPASPPLPKTAPATPLAQASTSATHRSPHRLWQQILLLVLAAALGAGAMGLYTLWQVRH